MEKATCVVPNTQMYERGSLPGNSAAQERVKWGEPYRVHAQPGGKIQFKMAGIQVSPHAFPSVHTRQQPGRVMCASSSPPHPNKRPNVHIVAIPIRHKLYILHLLKPTVSLDVIAVVASNYGYSRSHIEPHATQECTVHVATQRGRAKRLQHRHPPCVQPAAPMRECPCRRPRLPPRRGTAEAPSREQGHPGGAHGRRHDPSASPCHGRRCPPVSLLFASGPWLLHTGCSLQPIDMTVQ